MKEVEDIRQEASKVAIAQPSQFSDLMSLPVWLSELVSFTFKTDPFFSRLQVENSERCIFRYGPIPTD